MHRPVVMLPMHLMHTCTLHRPIRARTALQYNRSWLVHLHDLVHNGLEQELQRTGECGGDVRLGLELTWLQCS